MLCWCHSSKVRMGRQFGDHRIATVNQKTTCHDHSLNGSVCERTTTTTNLTTGHFGKYDTKFVPLFEDQIVTGNGWHLLVMTKKSGVWPSALVAELPHSHHHSSGCFPTWWTSFNLEIKSDTPSLHSAWAPQEAPIAHRKHKHTPKRQWMKIYTIRSPCLFHFCKDCLKGHDCIFK